MYQKAYVEFLCSPEHWKGETTFICIFLFSYSFLSFFSSRVRARSSSRRHLSRRQPGRPRAHQPFGRRHRPHLGSLPGQGRQLSSFSFSFSSLLIASLFQEIVQPTVVEPAVFAGAWREECFALWRRRWIDLVEEGPSRAFLEVRTEKRKREKEREREKKRERERRREKERTREREKEREREKKREREREKEQFLIHADLFPSEMSSRVFPRLSGGQRLCARRHFLPLCRRDCPRLAL